MHGTGFYQSISKLNLASEEEPAAFAKVCGVHGLKHLEDIEFYWRHLVSSKQDIHEQNWILEITGQPVCETCEFMKIHGPHRCKIHSGGRTWRGLLLFMWKHEKISTVIMQFTLTNEVMLQFRQKSASKTERATSFWLIFYQLHNVWGISEQIRCLKVLVGYVW